MCVLSNDIYEYNYVAQGKITIPNVDDGEELELTDVSLIHAERSSQQTHSCSFSLCFLFVFYPFLSFTKVL